MRGEINARLASERTLNRNAKNDSQTNPSRRNPSVALPPSLPLRSPTVRVAGRTVGRLCYTNAGLQMRGRQSVRPSVRPIPSSRRRQKTLKNAATLSRPSSLPSVNMRNEKRVAPTNKIPPQRLRSDINFILGREMRWESPTRWAPCQTTGISGSRAEERTSFRRRMTSH